MGEPARTLGHVSRLARMRAPIIAGTAGLLACGYVYFQDPGEPGHYPPCPLKLLTGLDCPFCGSLRATHELMHGNLPVAIDLNALTVFVILPVTMALLIAWTVQRWRGKRFEVDTPRWLSVAMVVGVLAFTVVRNLPGMWWGTTA